MGKRRFMFTTITVFICLQAEAQMFRPSPKPADALIIVFPIGPPEPRPPRILMSREEAKAMLKTYDWERSLRDWRMFLKVSACDDDGAGNHCRADVILSSPQVCKGDEPEGAYCEALVTDGRIEFVEGGFLIRPPEGGSVIGACLLERQWQWRIAGPNCPGNYILGGYPK